MVAPARFDDLCLFLDHELLADTTRHMHLGDICGYEVATNCVRDVLKAHRVIHVLAGKFV